MIENYNTRVLNNLTVYKKTMLLSRDFLGTVLIRQVRYMSDALKAAIDQLRIEVKDLADQIKGDPRISTLNKKVTALNTLEDLESQDKTSIGELLDFSASMGSAKPIVSGVGIEPDEFYGKEPLEAAKLFLRKKGKPANLQEIIQGIRTGGGNPGNESVLRTSLTRSTYQIAKINDDLFGLVEFYGGGLKRGRSAAKKKNGGDDLDETEEAAEEPAPVNESDGKE